MISLGAFTISLIDFAREVRIAVGELDHHARRRQKDKEDLP
jgi:hypothetical protein